METLERVLRRVTLRELRLLLDPFGEFGVEEGGQPRVLAGGRGGYGRCAAGHGGRQHQPRHHCRHADLETDFHADSPLPAATIGAGQIAVKRFFAAGRFRWRC